MTLLRRFAPHAWIAALAAALLFIALDAARDITQINRIADVTNALVQSPRSDASTPSGYENGLRHVVLPRQAIDGYHWLMQTQQMFATGELRIRRVDYDNAPYGREVHWASPFRWWLGLLAWCDHQLTGLPIGQCVERAGLYASPALLALFLLVITPSIARRFGSGFASWFVLGLTASVPLSSYFAAGNPDHHGLAAACALVTVLGLIAGGAGWIGPRNSTSLASPPDLRTARRWFALSAFAGAFGLWISAASQVPVLFAIGLGSLYGAFEYRKRAPAASAETAPDLWRFWGRLGAFFSVAAWLIEYFPSHLNWRLEVNHPLYALAWWGGGEVLRLWWQDPRPAAFLRNLSRPAAATACAAIILLPAVILIGGERVFRVSDRFLWALHHEYIAEFLSVGTFFSVHGFGLFFWASLLPWLLALPVLRALLRKDAPAGSHALIALAALPAFVFALMAFTQVRWLGLSHALLLLLVVVYRYTRPIPVPTHALPGHRIFAVCALLLLLPQLSRFVRDQTQPEGSSKTEIMELANREVAHWLNRRAGPERPVVASSPGISTTLAFHGGVKTLGTMYWENLDGLETSAAFFGARDEAAAFRIVQATGLTHLVIVSWNDFVEPYVKLIRGLNKDEPAPDDAFVLNLLRTKVPPPWLRPVPCVLPENPGLDDATVFVFEVVPPQSREESLVRLVNFLIDSRAGEQALRFLPALQNQAQYFPAQLSRARLYLLGGDEPAFLSTMRALLADPAPVAALALEDRVQFALLLAVIGDDARARHEFENCWAQARADHAALRRLPPSAIVYLLQQSTRLELPAPPDLLALAQSLLPPQWLAKLHEPL